LNDHLCERLRLNEAPHPIKGSGICLGSQLDHTMKSLAACPWSRNCPSLQRAGHPVSVTSNARPVAQRDFEKPFCWNKSWTPMMIPLPSAKFSSIWDIYREQGFSELRGARGQVLGITSISSGPEPVRRPGKSGTQFLPLATDALISSNSTAIPSANMHSSNIGPRPVRIERSNKHLYTECPRAPPSGRHAAPARMNARIARRWRAARIGPRP